MIFLRGYGIITPLYASSLFTKFELSPPSGARGINVEQEVAMKWYHYIGCFFAGAFLANTVPHFVQGISGNSFPTPFANPPGKGVSSPTINVLWALCNLVAGYVLFRKGRVSSANKWSPLVFFAGIASISIMSSIVFVGRAH